MICFWFVLFCKQKTAYEMRISDWSSDVCFPIFEIGEVLFERQRIVRRDIPDAFGRGAGGGLHLVVAGVGVGRQVADIGDVDDMGERPDRKSTRLNSSH